VIATAAEAPGKLFLTGEYAVLVGAPALVAAVDRRARVDVRLDDAPGALVVHSRLEDRTWRIDDVEREERTGGDLGAVLAAVRVATAWQPALAGRHVELEVESGAFLLGRQKLGLGRSAATVTAAVAALLAAIGRADPAQTCEASVAAHALFQDGHGSGADVVASARGGVIEFRRSGGCLSAVPRTLPPGLELLVGYTGDGAATDALVKRFASEAAKRTPAALDALSGVARRATDAVAASDAGTFTAAVDESAALLEELGCALDLPIVTPALARLIAAARGVGAAAKPSGAGGGDCGIAFATSPSQADAVRAAWRAAAIIPLPVAIDPRGVRWETAAADRAEARPA
jgi:phosphomevalonate kinase